MLVSSIFVQFMEQRRRTTINRSVQWSTTKNYFTWTYNMNVLCALFQIKAGRDMKNSISMYTTTWTFVHRHRHTSIHTHIYFICRRTFDGEKKLRTLSHLQSMYIIWAVCCCALASFGTPYNSNTFQIKGEKKVEIEKCLSFYRKFSHFNKLKKKTVYI